MIRITRESVRNSAFEHVGYSANEFGTLFRTDIYLPVLYNTSLAALLVSTYIDMPVVSTVLHTYISVDTYKKSIRCD